MVSLGDTAISLHILQKGEGGGALQTNSNSNSKCQDLPKFSFALPLSGRPCITDCLSYTTYVETNNSCGLSKGQRSLDYAATHLAFSRCKCVANLLPQRLRSSLWLHRENESTSTEAGEKFSLTPPPPGTPRGAYHNDKGRFTKPPPCND